MTKVDKIEESDETFQNSAPVKNSGTTVDIRTLKNKWRSSLGNVTKKRNELTGLMSNPDNLHLVKMCLEEYNEAFDKYTKNFNCVMDNILDELEQDQELSRYETKEISILQFRNHTGEWIAINEKRLEEDLESLLSRSGSERSSKRPSSLPSGKSATSEKVRAKARLAELLAEKELVTKKKEQEAKTEEILLDIEIAKTPAKARVSAETEKDIGDDNVDNKDNETHTSIIVQRANHQDVNVMVAGPSVAAPGSCASEGANTAICGNMANQVILPVTQENSVSLPSLNPSTAQEFVPRNSSETVTNTLATPVNASNAKSSTFPNLEQYTYPPVNTPVNSNFGAPYPLPNSPPVNTIQQQISGIATALALPAPEVPKFTGDLLEYSKFILAFDTRISSRTASSSCIYMQVDQGYVRQDSCYNKSMVILIKWWSRNCQVISRINGAKKATNRRLLENRSSCFGDIVQFVINAA
ncbi:uncharacterized protein [Palaemon carinicauda]|uniref:uncharacterized protein n=1 Tax=Palaemon carinicauda TaxID=392227 RepID=UPI0035B5943E